MNNGHELSPENHELPHVEPEIAKSLPAIDDQLAQDALNKDFGETQGDLFRAAIPWMEQARQAGADPGDALMTGLRMGISAVKAQRALDEFRSDASVTALFPERPHLKAIPDLPPAKPGWRERRAAHRQERHARRTAARMHVAIAGVIVLDTVRNKRQPNGDDAA